MNNSNWDSWYQSLIKPGWTPDPSIIGLIWTILYPIIFIVFAVVGYKAFMGQIPKSILIVFVVNIIANLLFTPIQFGLKNLPLASLDILIVLGTIIALIIMLWPYSKLLSLLLSPYLIWVAIASVLQLSITWYNR